MIFKGGIPPQSIFYLISSLKFDESGTAFRRTDKRYIGRCRYSMVMMSLLRNFLADLLIICLKIRL